MSAGCCALGTCSDPACDLCQRVAKLEQPAWTKDRQVRHAVPVSRPRPTRDPARIKRKRKALW